MRTVRLPLLALGTLLVLFACSGGDYQDVLRTLLEKERLVEQARYQLLLAASSTMAGSGRLRSLPLKEGIEQKVQGALHPSLILR